MKVSEIMSKKIEIIHEKESVETAAKLMVDEHIGALIILDKNEKLEGMITERDILKYLMKEYKIKKLPVVETESLVGIITATDLIKYEDKLVEKLSEIFLYTRKRPFMAG